MAFNWLKKLNSGLKKSSSKITTGISDIFTKRKLDDETLEELEELLLTSDMGIKATTKIITDFSKTSFDKEISIEEVKEKLSSNIEEILTPVEKKLEINKNKKPFIILMTGVNGAGKTTSIGKMAKKFTDQGYKVSLAAGDTFRAAAVEQLTVWAQRCNCDIYAKEIGADAAGLAYDAINSAIKNQDDILFIDTAGRLQNKQGLMEELKKIDKVIKKLVPDAPHASILTIDSTTGQNAHSQVKLFDEAVGLSGLIVTKLDGSAKGGVLVSLASEFNIPIHYIGVGEQIEDMQDFNAKEYSNEILDL